VLVGIHTRDWPVWDMFRGVAQGKLSPLCSTLKCKSDFCHDPTPLSIPPNTHTSMKPMAIPPIPCHETRMSKLPQYLSRVSPMCLWSTLHPTPPEPCTQRPPKLVPDIPLISLWPKSRTRACRLSVRSSKGQRARRKPSASRGGGGGGRGGGGGEVVVVEEEVVEEVRLLSMHKAWAQALGGGWVLWVLWVFYFRKAPKENRE
jgi:hypothetical protein